MDEAVRMMTKDGKSDAEICEALGIESKQLKNRLYNLKAKERAEEDDHTVETAPQETEIQPRVLNGYELELVDMIEERERQITAMEKRWEETDLENRRLTVKLRKAESLILKLVDELYGEG
jgi:transposase-like protein